MDRKHLSVFTKPLQFILDAALPQSCACCQQKIPHTTDLALCNECHFALPWLGHCCVICSLPLDSHTQVCGKCLLTQPDFASSKIPFRYDYPLNHLILDFKFNHHFARGKLLSQLLIDFLQDAYKDQPLPDALVPVPIHPWRRFRRGFNQSELLARDIARAIDIKAHYRLCYRQQQATSQKDSSKQARRDNLTNAFAVAPQKVSLIKGKHLALVDDVVTTGATVDELSRLLLQQGAASVVVWALARTPDLALEPR
jgi:ComF family protein